MLAYQTIVATLQTLQYIWQRQQCCSTLAGTYFEFWFQAGFWVGLIGHQAGFVTQAWFGCCLTIGPGSPASPGIPDAPLGPYRHQHKSLVNMEYRNITQCIPNLFVAKLFISLQQQHNKEESGQIPVLFFLYFEVTYNIKL